MSKMEKQLQLIMSAIFMVLAGFSGYGQNVGDQFTDDDITYEITSTAQAEVKIVDYTGSATEVDIPPTVNSNGTDYNVTAIGEDIDDFNSGTRPFEDKGLTRVTIPNTVTIIGLGAFNKNASLTEVTIPESVTIIGKWAFAQNNLKELTIPASVESIGEQAFFNNRMLAIVRLERNPPPEFHEIAFERVGEGFLGKTKVVVPLGVIQAYKDAGWADIKEFGTITSGFTNVGDITYGITTNRPEATVIDYINSVHHLTILPNVDINGSNYPVTAIGADAFQNTGVFALLTVTIPGSVKNVGPGAFYRSWDTISDLIMTGDEPPTLDPDAFEHLRRGTVELIVPEGKEQEYENAGWTGFEEIFSLKGRLHLNSSFLWEVTSLSPNEVKLVDYRGSGGDLEIPSEIEYLRNSEGNSTYSVTSIGDRAADREGYSGKLTSVVIPDGVRSIGDAAFGGNNLIAVDLPDALEHIGLGAFEQNQLTSVTIPDNVKDIERLAFNGNQLTEVTISGNVDDIDQFAFEDNPNLRLVTVEADDPPVLHKNTFVNADRDQIDLVVPLGTRQTYLDSGWEGFRSASFDTFTVDGITYVITSLSEVMAVNYTGTATAVTIPETVDHGGNTYDVTAIGGKAFQNKELVSVQIPVGITSIGERAFGNNELASVEIPSSVTSIGEMAFSDNLLTEVTIPSSVQSIGAQAFYNNPELDLVTVGATDPPALDAIAFVNASRHQIDLVVPMDTRQAYLDNGWGGFRSISDGSTPPRPTIDAPQNVDGSEPFTVNIRFDDEVTDFGLCGIQVANAMVSDFTGSGSTYTVTIVPELLCDGNITINVPANMVMGTNSLSYLAAQLVNVAVVDTIAPTITCPVDVEANASDNGTGDCTTTVDLGIPVTADNCSVTTVVAQVNGTDIDPDTYEFGIGETTVTWIVTDDAGNTASCGQIVTVATGNCSNSKEPLMDFNRGFSPNGDGIGDTLVIEGLEKYKNNVVKIYNLSQRLLFSAHYGGPGDGWNGTHKGERVPVGSYVCVIDYNESGLDYETKMIYVNY
ncbi:leucine-rich repeat protein [Aquimarina sp. AU474]|uniref:leucine-rich repeat protein n=1 Tax=Aquimarina sp. AU474 TaxID=2108529 RepID=UPI000D68C0FB|nr:leucine-rich repeat protein [Aquimarina sp. AU474]